MKNFLFICMMNKWRSRTAESIFKNLQNINVKSAGTSSKAQVKVSSRSKAQVKVSSRILEWADKVFVMEEKHKEIIIKKFRTELTDKKIVILGIEGSYKFMDLGLIEILEREIENEL